MPPEEKKEKLNIIRKKLSASSKEYHYHNRLMKRLKNSDWGLGIENLRLSKQIIKENTDNFKDKYTDPNSEFQKRLAYLKEKLSEEEYQASPEYKLNSIVSDFIDKGIKEYSSYASIDTMYGHQIIKLDSDGSQNTTGQNEKILTNRARESEHLKNSIEYFNQLEKQLDSMMDTEFGKTETFQQFYAEIKDFADETRRITDGGLVVPTNKKDAVFIRMEESKEVIDPVTKKKTIKKVMREPVINPIEKPRAKESDPKEYNPVEYLSFENEPLFSHDPCPEDIAQGHLGDCYFIATMSAVAENNPDYIRNCMKDNGDGTVTVRLFDKNQREIYTTVNKTIPVIKVSNGQVGYAYASGSLWVSIMEKAYVQSGIAHNLCDSFAQGKTKAPNGPERNSYEEVVGGRTEIASINILGTDILETEEEALEISIPVTKDIDSQNGYTQAELEFFNKIKKDYDGGHVLTAGIYKIKGQTDVSYEESKGLPPGHAYTVIGTSVDEKTGKKFIKIRNPHMGGGRAYNDNGEAYYDPNPKRYGESLIELRDFEQSFSTCFSAVYLQSYSVKKQAKMVNDDKTMYADAVKQACEEIIATDPAYVLTNSKSFRDFQKGRNFP